MNPPRERVLCAGAAHWDVIGRGAGPVRHGDDVPGAVTIRPGGVALNVAMGLAGAGLDVSLCAAIGQDMQGQNLLAEAARAGIGCEAMVRCPNDPTDTYVAIEDGEGALVAAIAGTALPERQASAIVEAGMLWLGTGTGGTVFLDANLPEQALAGLADAARHTGCEVAVNPVSPAKAGRLAPLLGRGLQPAIIANRAEAAAILGVDAGSAATAASALIERGAGTALITDGAHAAALATGREVFDCPVTPIPGGSVTGAGDALIAGYLGFRDRQKDPKAALSAAVASAARHMRTPG